MGRITIVALASVLIVNAVTIGTSGHIALARHHDNTKVFENSHINVQTYTISQGTPTSSLCTTTHPTVLTLNPISTNGYEVLVTGTLTDTCTGSGVAGATITFSVLNGTLTALTTSTGKFGIGLEAPSGKYTIGVHFAGQGIFGPSNSTTETFTFNNGKLEP